MFSDDIQGIAAVVIAGMLAAQPLTGKRLSEHTFLFAGEGRGATAIAEASAAMQAHESASDSTTDGSQLGLPASIYVCCRCVQLC